MTPAVQVRGLSKSYGQLHAVRELDLDVGYGEIFAILGPNGAGKSTTIEILEGHRKRDSGQVRVLGEDPGVAGRQWRARIGIVLQEASDFGMLTVAETVRMFAKCYGEARVPEELLELVGLGSVPIRESGRSPGDSGAGSTSRSASSPSRTAVSRRTDHGVRSRSETAVLGSHQAVGRRRHHDPAHHPLPGGGRRAGGPRRGHRRRPVGRGGFAAESDRHVNSAATVRWMEDGESARGEPIIRPN